MLEALDLNKEFQNDNKIVSSWLLNYDKLKQDYLLQRESILHSSPPAPDGQPKGSGTGNPVESKGLKLSELQESERWFRLVDELEKGIPWKMQLILNLKRKHRRGAKGRPINWLVALEFSEEVSKRIKKDYSVGPDAVRKWWDLIVEYGARLAGKRGLL